MTRNAIMSLYFKTHNVQLEFTSEDEDIESDLAAAIDRQDSIVINGPLTFTDPHMIPPSRAADYFILDTSKLLFATVKYGPTLTPREETPSL